MENFDWVQYLSNNDVGNKWRLIKTKLSEVWDKFVPISKIRPLNKKHNFPLDRITRRKIKEKNNLATKAIRSKNPEAHRGIG